MMFNRWFMDGMWMIKANMRDCSFLIYGQCWPNKRVMVSCSQNRLTILTITTFSRRKKSRDDRSSLHLPWLNHRPVDHMGGDSWISHSLVSQGLPFLSGRSQKTKIRAPILPATTSDGGVIDQCHPAWLVDLYCWQISPVKESGGYSATGYSSNSHHHSRWWWQLMDVHGLLAIAYDY